MHTVLLSLAFASLAAIAWLGHESDKEMCADMAAHGVHISTSGCR